MPGFAQGIIKDKLAILFFLQVVAIDITREQLHRAIVENDCMDYFSFCSAMFELEEDGMIAAVPRAFGQVYCLTEQGKESLSLLEDTLPFSVRVSLSAYAETARNTLIEETQLSSAMDEMPDGSYQVTLNAVERNNTILKIQMRLASRNMANKIRNNWENVSEKVYEDLLNRLLNCPEEK